MCEHCNLLSGDKKDFGEAKRDILKIDRHNNSYLISTDSSIDFDDEREIYFCPMCGRKLCGRKLG